MRSLHRTLCVAAALAACAPLSAQTDSILYAARGGEMRLRLNADGGFVVRGSVDDNTPAVTGRIPATGAGARLMWYPAKGAFRAGDISDASMAEDAQIGYNSFAFGNARASGDNAIAMGASAQATGPGAIALGSNATASGSVSFAWGNQAIASGLSGLALGTRTAASHRGSIVIGDESSTAWLNSRGNHTFTARAAGGVTFFTRSDTTLGVRLDENGTSWNVVSDRRRKENFLALDDADVLARIRRVPVTTWSYIGQGGPVRHIGPMAQDWNRAFGLNADTLAINQGDFDGVNLAGIQALDRRGEAQERVIAAQQRTIDAQGREIAGLRDGHAALRGENAELRARLERLEARLAPRP